ncbi:DUF2024 family protein [Winogradskyella sp.]|uniref:DUF2024 family protein n=1 Tax=Winogradskyella sp. TaxID=1883156 RepID=UPI003BACDA55
MKIAVWDTYVKRENGSLMHFDILVPNDLTNEQDIYNFGNDYLKSKPFKTDVLSSKECRFCHIEHGTEIMINDIENQGYSIIEMENCS